MAEIGAEAAPARAENVLVESGFLVALLSVRDTHHRWQLQPLCVSLQPGERAKTFAVPTILTTDDDFRIYRRHGRQVVPCVTPS